MQKKRTFFLKYWRVAWICLAICFADRQSFAKKNDAKKGAATLPFPTASESIDTIDDGVHGIFREDNQLFFSLKGKDYFIQTPFFGIKENQQSSFGAKTDSKRIVFVQDVGKGDWRGVIKFGERILFMDGQTIRMISVLAKDGSFISQRTLALDSLKPAADAQGEPTKIELAATRKKFSAEFSKTEGTKLVGMTLMPKKFQGKDKIKFLVATRIPSFPIVEMVCATDDISSCFLDRSCFVENAKNMKPSSISGISYSKKRNILVIADKDNRSIRKFKLNSCFDIPQIGEIGIPSQIKNITSVFVDDEDFLWVSSNKHDDFNNASVYTWKSNEW